MANNELKHWKYIDRYKKNGEWIYVYPGEKAKKNILGKTVQPKYGPKTVEDHQRLNRNASFQVARNTPSRNIPGANDQTSTSGGKQMSKLQQDKAKYMAKYLKETSAYGNSGLQKKTNIDTGTMNWHKQQLKKAETANEHNMSGSSKNTREYKEFQNKFGNDRQTLMNPVKTTQKQIKQGIRRAKIKTLKRDAAEAIDRAKKWFEDLFD